MDEIKTGFFKTLWILRNYLPEMVIGGGWVPMIYYHYVIGDKSKEPVRTRDLYYIFDVLVNLETMEDQIQKEMVEIKKKYPAWFKRFLKNLEKYFGEPMSGGIDLVLSQRPQNAFTALTDDQFKQYVFSFFDDFVQKTKSK
jgi:hypothetical protein